jgi:hypothetical protein
MTSRHKKTHKINVLDFFSYLFRILQLVESCRFIKDFFTHFILASLNIMGMSIYLFSWETKYHIFNNNSVLTKTSRSSAKALVSQ